MNSIKEIIIKDLLKDITKISKKINTVSLLETPKDLAELASDGSFGCPSYYGLIHEGCKNHTSAMCRRCWLKALNEAFETSNR